MCVTDVFFVVIFSIFKDSTDMEKSMIRDLIDCNETVINIFATKKEGWLDFTYKNSAELKKIKNIFKPVLKFCALWLNIVKFL